MLVDKFGRNGYIVYIRINIANLTNSFPRRDGRNTAIGAIYIYICIYIYIYIYI